jgi:hypothetical protein
MFWDTLLGKSSSMFKARGLQSVTTAVVVVTNKKTARAILSGSLFAQSVVLVLVQ